MKRFTVVELFVISLLLLSFAESLMAEDRIPMILSQISALSKQKEQFEMEKQALIAEGEELSEKIEELKIQARSGLGIIGRYKLSRDLRKAQKLSEEIQSIEGRIYEISAELSGKTDELEKEYERQIAILIQRLNTTEKAEEKKLILGRIKEYQTEKDRLTRLRKEKPERLDIARIEIEEYDGPREIREKADLIKDVANKVNARIAMLDSKIARLKDELKTRKKIGEFAEEISFFGERVSREERKEMVKKPITKEEPAETPIEKTNKEEVPPETFAADTATRSATEPTTPPPTTQETTTGTTETQTIVSTKKLMKSNGVSANLPSASLSQIEEEIKLLEKQKQDLKKELSILSDKAKSFYKKAEEIEKSGTGTGDRKGTGR